MTGPAIGRHADLRELRALEQIERNPHITQRQLANELGVALGVANACVRTLVRKGLVKVRGDSNRSISYHLTKEGVLRKAALALTWTNNTISDYLAARARIRRQLESLAQQGVSRVVLLGADEAAELVALVAPQAGVTVLGAIDVGAGRIADALAGVPVSEPHEAVLDGIDAVVVASPLVDAAAFADMHPEAPILDLTGRPVRRSVR